jgi:hypothetical protein
VAETEARRYRLPPLVSTGLFGAFSTAQVVALGVGAAVALCSVLVGLAAIGGVALAVATVVAFKRVGALQLHELLVLKVAWLRRHLRGEIDWARPVPLLGAGERGIVALPPMMAGLEVFDHGAGNGRAGVAVVHDRTGGSVSVVLRARGDSQFSLSSPLEQDQRVASWGESIAGFCRENSAVSRVTWQEWSAAGGADEHFEQVRASVDDIAASATANYLRLLERVGPTSTSHETLITVTVDVGRVRLRRRQTGDALAAAVDTLLEEARLFAGRMEAGGLRVDPALTPAELTAAVRRRSDPTVIPHENALRRSLAASIGRAAVDFGPMAVREHWTHVQIDRALHRSYWVQSWPRLDVPAAWMDPLLLGTHGTRTLTVVFEPIAPSAAARAVDQAAIALDAAEATRTKHGFRIRASERRKRSEIEEREHELVAGHGDLACVGLLTVTATDEDTLDDVAADYESAAGHAGVELRPLESRHAAGWVAALPLGRSLARQRQPLT